MKVVELVGCSAGLDGLHLEVRVERRVQSTLVLPPATITIPLSQLESLLDAVALGMRTRHTLAGGSVITVMPEPICPYCESNQFYGTLPGQDGTNARCISCGRLFRLKIVDGQPRGEKL
jgi:hypothetical protein